MVKLIDDSLAELKPKTTSKPAPKDAPAPPPAEEKWSREKHPAFKKTATPATTEETAEASAPVVYQVNDTVMAKWISGDKGFYAARITSVTGSSTNPVYTVKFKSYDTVETLRSKDIRPNSQKRKADGSAVSAAAPTAGSFHNTSDAPPQPSSSNNGVVLSAAASLYPQTQQPGKDGGTAEGEEKPRKNFKKIKANKELEAGKSKWQEFNSKGKFGKSHKKDSMFRTPEGVNGRGMCLFPSPRRLLMSN
jgi:survival-of-motor-neuron-related-splicing factor 30